ncbi:cytochrome c551 [Melghiribacillus thermohalophilus]|uniref:Cytochrome c551 n=1 Tax=Melghiribacillus thermohalophilus TaxID=1324956 RepID=A0A4V2V0V7_9BACI|nr:cytochrome c [Melghiribacillus thermohalophilus]TCT18752.1 cytochrome c551 [Melghiribacillus thermohalophilus]
MKKKLMALLFGSALVLAACGGGDDNADNGDNGDTADNGADTEEPADNGEGTVDTAAAEEIYNNNCSMCHGADLSGGAGPDLRQIGGKYSKEEIVNIIKNGMGNMQAVNISDDDANTVAEWLAAKQ